MRSSFLLLIVFCFHSVFSISIPIGSSITEINGLQQPWSSLTGGDTLLLEAGKRDPLQFANLAGTAKKPIVIINNGGLTEIKSTRLPYGISLRNCHYIKLSGKGAMVVNYGIKIAKVSPDGAGIGASDKTDNIEIEYIEICNTKGPGMLCKTNPDCNIDSKNFTAYNFSIHHNYIHHTGTEGLYIGSTAFEGEQINCNGEEEIVPPPMLYSVYVFSNRVEYTGWDGIQISNSENVLCYSNSVLYDSQKQTEWQNCGLMIGGGTSGKFYDNIIAHGQGYAINCFGNKSVEIINNTITMNSDVNKIAVYISDKLAKEPTVIAFKGNRISTEVLPAIKFANKKMNVVCNVESNNVIPSADPREYYVIEK